jgi:hypothetical protein
LLDERAKRCGPRLVRPALLGNPDLPERLRLTSKLAPYDRNPFWSGDHRGYTDFPFQKNVAKVC